MKTQNMPLTSKKQVKTIGVPHHERNGLSHNPQLHRPNFRFTLPNR